MVTRFLSLLVVVGCGAGGPAPTSVPLGAAPTPPPPVATAEAGPPPAWESPAAMTATCDAALATAEATRALLKGPMGGERIPSETLKLFDSMLLALDTTNGLVGIASQMHPDEQVRTAGEECEKRIAKFYSDVGLDRALFEVVAGVPLDGLTPDARRYAERLLRDFRRSGVDRDEATRKRLAQLNEEMVKIGQDYGKNVRDDVRFIEIDPAGLKGLPDDFIKSHAPGPNGKVKVTTDYPDFFPFQEYAEDGALRKALYLAFDNRGHPANQQLLVDLLAKRAEYAKLLGYPDWAAYQAEDKMVKTPERVDGFIRQVADATRPRMEADLKELLARKRKDDPKAERVEVWDRFYYASKVRAEQYAFDGRTVRPYFPYQAVKQGIFDLYGELFGLRFEPIPGAVVWHPSVEAWNLYAGDERIGRFYLDMHPREGKYKHAAMFPLQTGLEGGRVPMATLVCNFPDPKTDAALMQHGDVTTFFHEFGHLIHHLLARKARWSSQAGLSVEWDFVETPSQLLEEWAWSAPVLQRFARHHETGEPIPADLVQRMRNADEFGKGVAVMRQVFFAAYSFYLHRQDPKGLQLDAFSEQMYRSYSPYPAIADGHMYSSFEHLVGYSSSYYTYQWSLVIAKDIFTLFEGKELDPAPMQRYRQIVLEQGATKDADQLVQELLGRPYNLDAYRKWLTSGQPPGG